MVAFPFNDSESYDDRWRKLHDHEQWGVVGDATGTGCKVTANGASTTVVVQPGRFKVLGFELEATTTTSFNLGAIGSQPTAGQTRIDRVVVRLTSTDIVFAVVAGTPAATGAVPPALTQTDPGGTGTFEVNLAQVTRNGVAAVSQGNVADHRTWLGQDVYAANAYALLPAEPIGKRIHRGDEVYERVLSGLGSPMWQTRAAQFPALAIRKTASTNLIPTPNTWTSIEWDADTVREGDLSMHSPTIGNASIFLNVAGWWDVTFTFTPDIANTGGQVATSVMQLDSGLNFKVRHRGAAFARATGDQSTYETHATLLAASGDIVRGQVWSSVANIYGISTADAACRITVHRVR